MSKVGFRSLDPLLGGKCSIVGVVVRMGSPGVKISPQIRGLAKKKYVETTLTQAEIATKFKISRQTVSKWVKEDHWEAARAAYEPIVVHESMPPKSNVIDMSKPRRASPAEPPAPPPVRAKLDSDNPLAIADMTIADLQGAMMGCDGKDKAAIANALKAWVQYRAELQQPRTVREFAEQFLATGLPIHEFVKALRDSLTA
jgi:hypothetical protein